MAAEHVGNSKLQGDPESELGRSPSTSLLAGRIVDGQQNRSAEKLVPSAAAARIVRDHHEKKKTSRTRSSAQVSAHASHGPKVS
jgi:hypothetical protein